MARPRTITPSPEELIELGKDLLAWATEETPELRCRFCQWYSLKKDILDDEWELMIRKTEFIGYYEKARVALAQRYIDGSVKEGISHRFMRIYAPEVKREEDETSAYNASLKAKEDKKASEIEIGHLEAVLDVVKAAQASYSESARNIEDKRRRKESMS